MLRNYQSVPKNPIKQAEWVKEQNEQRKRDVKEKNLKKSEKALKK